MSETRAHYLGVTTVYGPRDDPGFQLLSLERDALAKRVEDLEYALRELREGRCGCALCSRGLRQLPTDSRLKGRIVPLIGSEP